MQHSFIHEAEQRGQSAASHTVRKLGEQRAGAEAHAGGKSRTASHLTRGEPCGVYTTERQCRGKRNAHRADNGKILHQESLLLSGKYFLAGINACYMPK